MDLGYTEQKVQDFASDFTAKLASLVDLAASTLSPLVIGIIIMAGFVVLAVTAERKQQKFLAAFLAAGAWLSGAVNLLIWLWTKRAT